MTDCQKISENYFEMLNAFCDFKQKLLLASKKNEFDKFSKERVSSATDSERDLRNKFDKLLDMSIILKNVERMKFAEKVLGKDYLGPMSVRAALGLELSLKEIPPIQFSDEEILSAKERGCALILRVNRKTDNSPLTAYQIADQASKILQIPIGSSEVENRNYFEKDYLFGVETPRVGWAIVSKGAIDVTINYNFADQISNLVGHMAQFYTDRFNDRDFIRALDHWGKYMYEHFYKKNLNSDIELQINSDKYSREIAELEMSKYLRHTLVEAFYDACLYYLNTGRDLYNGEIITNSVYNGLIVKFRWTENDVNIFSGFVECYDKSNTHGAPLAYRK